MLSGERVYVDTTEFLNDMHIIRSKNDVLTVLIHLGYLAYDEDEQECFIPNKEVADELNNAIKATSWEPLIKTIQNSKALLNATISDNEQAVVSAIDLAHDENTSTLSYNDENSLACVLSVTYIWVKNEIAEYTGDILLVGINYDKESKQHTCKIERTII